MGTPYSAAILMGHYHMRQTDHPRNLNGGRLLREPRARELLRTFFIQCYPLSRVHPRGGFAFPITRDHPISNP